MVTLPFDIIDRFGHLPDAQKRTGNEYSSACPKCGGGRGGHDPADRFRVWERQGQASNFWCRRCGYQGFTDDNRVTYKPDAAKLKELEDIRQRESAKEAQRLQSKIEQLRKDAYWQGWHDAMSDNHRQLWRRQGIPDSLQDWFKLGYKEHHSYKCGDSMYESSAMTIPVFDYGWQAINLQYRLMNPVNGAGKYRFTSGLPAPLYITEPDEKLSGPVLMVEGAKKAIVIFAHMGHKFKVVAVPSKSPGQQVIARLAECDPVYIVLDPDAYITNRGESVPAVNRLVKMIGTGRARIVKLPAKPDDLFVEYGINAATFERYVELARKI
jgi:hypothetical protein